MFYKSNSCNARRKPRTPHTKIVLLSSQTTFEVNLKGNFRRVLIEGTEFVMRLYSATVDITVLSLRQHIWPTGNHAC
jgi:hypothetical protein